MSPISFNTFNSLALTTVLAAATQTGCSGGGVAAAGTGILALGVGCGYLLERWSRGRADVKPALLEAPAAPVIPPLLSRRTPDARTELIQRTAPPPPQVAPETARALQDAVRFTASRRIDIDLSRYPEGLFLRVGRRERNGLTWEGGKPVLGLDDGFVSTSHADISLHRIAVRTWSLFVEDRSMNGTQVVGWGKVQGSGADLHIPPSLAGVHIRVGDYDLHFKLNDPLPVPAAPPAQRAFVPRPAAAKPAVPALAPIAVTPVPLVPTQAPVAPRKAWSPEVVRGWAEEAVPSDVSVGVTASNLGMTVHLRPKDPSLAGSILFTLPEGTTEASVRCVCDYLTKHCHAFRPAGKPTMNIALEWHERPNVAGTVLLRGAGKKNAIVVDLGDRVSGALSESDLLNVGGFPQVLMGFTFDPEPTKQVIRMIEQIRDAFKRTREALGKVGARWEAIDPIAGIFGE